MRVPFPIASAIVASIVLGACYPIFAESSAFATYFAGAVISLLVTLALYGILTARGESAEEHREQEKLWRQMESQSKTAKKAMELLGTDDPSKFLAEIRTLLAERAEHAAKPVAAPAAPAPSPEMSPSEKEERAAAKSRERELTRRNRELESELAETRRLLQESEAREAALTQTESTTTFFRARAEELTVQCEALGKETAAVQNQLAESVRLASEAASEFEKERSRTKEELSALNARVEARTRELASVRQQLGELGGVAAARASEISSLAAQLERTNRDLLSARRELGEARTAVSDRDIELGEIRNRMRSLEEERGKEALRADGLERSLEESRLSRSQLELRVEQLVTASRSNTNRPIERACKRCATLRGQLQTLQTEHTRLDARLTLERQGLADAERQWERLRSGFEHRITDLVTREAKLTEEISALRKQVKESAQVIAHHDKIFQALHSAYPDDIDRLVSEL